ncbi:MAG: Uma2 family endonuclease [Singulisphaera sp.]
MASLSQTRVGMTLEDFLKLPEESPSLEFIDGRIEAKVSPQQKHGRIQVKLTSHINQFAEPHQIGLAFPELRCTFAGRSIVPDVVFLLREHIELDKRGTRRDPTPGHPRGDHLARADGADVAREAGPRHLARLRSAS